ncbi:hypothetical protein [Streptomyces glomeratus]|uniref:Uncharacterized protein n=1 Tax=Streptomyces glomeratus TaxID=284452 RepID=A0ABP6LRR0_9ACTN|nr:hypothetical protein [Streptomyces glomeratus]MCF1508238.1 hypothetical protein [Streptomyces glomeratus]
MPRAVGPHPSASREADELSDDGTHVVLLSPDRAARRARGRNRADDSRRPAAARAGHAQGVAVAASVAGIWG